jgi:hypothetical protein
MVPTWCITGMTTTTASAAASTTEPTLGRQAKRGTGSSLVDETVRAIGGYYGRLGRIGLDLASIVLPIDDLRDAAARLRFDVGPDFRPRISLDGDVVDRPRSVASSPTLLVEGNGDRPGFGVFVVENLTADPVSAPIQVSAFVDDRGNEVRPRLVLRPSTLQLGPGEHAMVQLAAELDDALESGVRYRGEIAIPGLSDRRIPIVLRRRPPTEEAPIAKRPIAKTAAAKPAAAKPAAAKSASAKPATARRQRAASTPAKPAATRPRRRSTSGPDVSR